MKWFQTPLQSEIFRLVGSWLKCETYFRTREELRFKLDKKERDCVGRGSLSLTTGWLKKEGCHSLEFSSGIEIVKAKPSITNEKTIKTFSCSKERKVKVKHRQETTYALFSEVMVMIANRTKRNPFEFYSSTWDTEKMQPLSMKDKLYVISMKSSLNHFSLITWILHFSVWRLSGANFNCWTWMICLLPITY